MQLVLDRREEIFSDLRAREIAKRMIELGDSDEKVAAVTDLSKEDIVVLRSQLEK
jgi:hypothetical protein